MKPKTYMVILPLSAVMLFVSLPEKADAQFIIGEVITAAIKKVVKAIDLQVQRLQNQTIWLQNAQKAIENQLSKLKLDEISDWSQKQKDLYAQYYQELQTVKSAIQYYQRVKDITETQTSLVAQYNQAWGLLSHDQHFSSAELSHMQSVYNGILRESVKELDELMVLVSSFKTQMSDEKRLELIDAVAVRLETNAGDLKRFNRENYQLSLSRAKDQNELQTLKQYYGVH